MTFNVIPITLAALSLSTLALGANAVPTVNTPAQESAPNKGGIGALGRDVNCQLTHPNKGYAITQAVEIIDVQEDGAAYQKGLRSGDLLITINGHAVANCADVAQRIAQIPQDGQISLELMRGKELIQIQAERRGYQPAKLDSKHALEKASQLIERQKANRPVTLSAQHRAQIAVYSRAIKAQLAASPDETNARAIISNMQKIRNVFRDSNTQSDGWMKGNAGAATIQLKKNGYILTLMGMNNQLNVEVYDRAGKLLFASPMDTVEQRRQMPDYVLNLFRSFK